MAAAAFRDAGVRWVCAGWTVFTVENLVMSSGTVSLLIGIVIEQYCGDASRLRDQVHYINMQSTSTCRYHCSE